MTQVSPLRTKMGASLTLTPVPVLVAQQPRHLQRSSPHYHTHIQKQRFPVIEGGRRPYHHNAARTRSRACMVMHAVHENQQKEILMLSQRHALLLINMSDHDINISVSVFRLQVRRRPTHSWLLRDCSSHQKKGLAACDRLSISVCGNLWQQYGYK